jgi:hypothetical protein
LAGFGGVGGTEEGGRREEGKREERGMVSAGGVMVVMVVPGGLRSVAVAACDECGTTCVDGEARRGEDRMNRMNRMDG